MAEKPIRQTTVVIVGASAAGLATAACLKEANIGFILLEKSSQVGQAWRNHYDRLHLHTNKRLSTLPGLSYPKSTPQYPTRQQVVLYLEDYIAHHHLEPQFDQTVIAVEQLDDAQWVTETQDTCYQSQHIVMATGYTRQPNIPRWDGQENFTGDILHSSQYKNGQPYADQHVLVVGFGNSACEIALDLHEHGAHPCMSVRSAVNVIPRDLFGIPILGIGIVMAYLPPRVADWLAWPLLRVKIGDITKYGLHKLPYGPNVQIRQDKQIPLLDIGTMDLIKRGAITIYPDITRFANNTVDFRDGRSQHFDAVILGTGYRPAVHEFLKSTEGVLDKNGTPLVSGQATALKGLYFCGFYVSPTGMLREVGLEAQRIAQLIQSTG